MPAPARGKSGQPKPAGPSVYCVGSRSSFDPETRTDDAEGVFLRGAADALARNDLRSAINSWFDIPAQDSYVYHALMSVRLVEVQRVVTMGAQKGPPPGYINHIEEPLPPPSLADIEAYLSIFDPAQSSAAALRSFGANAKKGSIRRLAADHLAAKRFVHPALSQALAVPKRKKGAPPHPNPYLLFWAWSCRTLGWCGPTTTTAMTDARGSHPILPVLMHHFGCVAPSLESLEILRVLAAGRTVVDVGSGNGYWSFMLRRHGVPTVAVDNEQSLWRTMWIPDTVKEDGVSWLRRQDPPGGKDMVLLLVYPIVGSDGNGTFTRSLLDAYEGDTVAVVGTQNRNGYTSFARMTMDEYMADAHAQGSQGDDHDKTAISDGEKHPWVRVVQIPLPSFAAKDEALFVFQRGDRAPKEPATSP
ncbi:hypothetical protein MAPG_02375 [Magnaporthiopsis poae ATCC 64411]|uniref:Uncharacterized protein n=1 Tax=Magnaporthiopsis poae (strain ATCC 64411 / 73-15) TaxID=644358 RepID=A0A0C4DR71_MAGP6|nr:hypothetical protein MAPG_02375 [Magnaporthiopsis poae ATCC 64411]